MEPDAEWNRWGKYLGCRWMEPGGGCWRSEGGQGVTVGMVFAEVERGGEHMAGGEIPLHLMEKIKDDVLDVEASRVKTENQENLVWFRVTLGAEEGDGKCKQKPGNRRIAKDSSINK